jgi:hypothetical protein
VVEVVEGIGPASPVRVTVSTCARATPDNRMIRGNIAVFMEEPPSLCFLKQHTPELLEKSAIGLSQERHSSIQC